VSPRIGVCDYGVGNLRSVERALLHAGATVTISADAADIADCDGAVLPGVGAFTGAVKTLRENGLAGAVTGLAAAGKPVLGVCLGFQLLFEHSDEGDGAPGLGLLPGAVTRLRGDVKVPHMGWNRLRLVAPAPLLDAVEDGAYMYFVHSYTAAAEAGDVVAVSDYGGEIVAMVSHGSVAGTQFHPEKSGAAGLRIYANFVASCAPSRN
jgi:glutamine amidotransferase